MAEFERKKEFRTTVDGAVVKGVYTPNDLGELKEDNSFPGKYPLTRHIRATGYSVADTIDPLGGSYYIEYLTNHIEEDTKIY